MNIERSKYNHRKDPRVALEQDGQILDSEGRVLGSCITLDVSAGGAKIEFHPGLKLPESFVLVLSNSVKRECKVTWRGWNKVGVQFLKRRWVSRAKHW